MLFSIAALCFPHNQMKKTGKTELFAQRLLVTELKC